MESAFLGVLIFGREKVSARFYWLSAFLVFFASHLSGFWIIAANSWMQTPAGFEKIMVDGALSRVVMTDFSEALFNGSTVSGTCTWCWPAGSPVRCSQRRSRPGIC
jgi:cytochrome d ubiquinol oxidase subunit I